MSQHHAGDWQESGAQYGDMFTYSAFSAPQPGTYRETINPRVCGTIESGRGFVGAPMCFDSSVMNAWQKVSISMRDLPYKHASILLA